MKKYLVVIVLVILTITGCKKTLRCSGEADYKGKKVDIDMKVYFDKDDKVTDADITYDFNGEVDNASYFCDIFNFIGYEVKCNGTKVSVKNYYNMLSNEEKKDIVGMTREGLFEIAEQEKYTCK